MGKLLNELSSGSSKRKIRVAIIGAGPSGLSALHAFVQTILLDNRIETQLELVCFESQPISNHGEPDSGNLWTNGLSSSFLICFVVD